MTYLQFQFINKICVLLFYLSKTVGPPQKIRKIYAISDFAFFFETPCTGVQHPLDSRHPTTYSYPPNCWHDINNTNVKMTGETMEVRSDKRKPREDRRNHRYHGYHRYRGSHRYLTEVTPPWMFPWLRFKRIKRAEGGGENPGRRSQG